MALPVPVQAAQARPGDPAGAPLPRGGLVPPDIPGAKRAGLPVDLDRLTAEGDEWLSPEERYALKMHGLCAQARPGVFMVRVRVGAVLESAAARGLARNGNGHGRGW